MPRSEVLDARGDLRRTRLPGFSDSVVGVRFVDGVALDPMPPTVIARLQGIGLPVEDLGPWEEAPAPAAAPEPPVAPAETEEGDDDQGDEPPAEDDAPPPPQGEDAPTTRPTRTARKRATP